MGFVVAVILFFIGTIFQKIHKALYNPASFMCYFWSIIAFAASLRLFGLNEVSAVSWFIILVGVISFVFGAQLNFTINKNREYYLQEDILQESFIPIRWFWILFIILSIFILFSLKTSIQLMKSGYTLDVIRQVIIGAQEIKEYTYHSSAIFYYLRYIQNALQTLLIATGIELFFVSKQRNLRYLLVVLFITVADAVSNGGRWIIMYTGIEFAIGYMVIKKKFGGNRIVKISRKVKIYLIISIIALLVALDRITTSRLSGGFIRHFYVYLCGCVPFLDSKLPFLASNDYFTIAACGGYGVWSFIAPYLRIFTGDYGQLYSNAMDIMSNIQVFEHIGQNQDYNAFVTAFYYLYADFRWIGIVIGMYVFGMISGKIFRKAVQDNAPNKISFVVPYMIVSQMILKSIQSYPLSANSYVVLIIIMIILFKIQNRSYVIKY